MTRWVVLATLAMAISGPATAQVVSGPATAIDGRTLDMTGLPLRLSHIDAPELRQSCLIDEALWPCGQEAKAALAEIIRGRTVRCTLLATDSDQMKIAKCEASDFDIAREMVRRGMAITSEHAPFDYGEAQAIATRLNSGLWKGQFERPSQWRQSHAEDALSFAYESQPSQDNTPVQQPIQSEKRYSNAMGCTIKGNHSRRGDWIYHVPGQRYYKATRPEALFCTESEARAAGYRRSKE